MKTIISHLLLLITFALFLIFPIHTLNGAASGLLLWYNILLPNLLPFIIVTTLIIRTEAYIEISNLIGPYIGRLFQVSKEGSIAIIIGFLCGYPMGAKVINDLHSTDNISTKEAQYLLSFCNNTSPMFILSFFLLQILENQSLLIPVVIALYSAPLLMSCITRRIYKMNTTNYMSQGQSTQKRSNTKIRFSFGLLDEAIIDSILLIMKIGGYIMLFSIFITLSLAITNDKWTLLAYGIPLLEITNGLELYQSVTNPTLQYLCMIFLVSFGGLCSIGQTSCVITSDKIKVSHYFLQKIITAMIAVIISVLILFITSYN